MGYYLRAFCKDDGLPPLGRVFEWTAAQGVSLALADDSELPVDLDSAEWKQATIQYESGKQPFIVDASRAGVDALLAEEVEEFTDYLEEVDESPGKAKVLEHLQESRAVVGMLLLEDINDRTAVRAFLRFFEEHCGGMVQADGEGFYEGDSLIVELE